MVLTWSMVGRCLKNSSWPGVKRSGRNSKMLRFAALLARSQASMPRLISHVQAREHWCLIELAG
jgi:hypothetical protein